MSDTSQYLYYCVRMPENETITYSTTYVVYGYTFEALILPSSVFTISSPPDPTSTDIQSMTEDERIKLGITTVYRENVIEYAKAHDLSDRMVEEILAANDDVYYFTSCASTVVANPSFDSSAISIDTSDDLVVCLENELKRSARIVDAYSIGVSAGAEDCSDVVEKHTEYIRGLNSILEYLESPTYSEYTDLDKALMDYLSIRDACYGNS